MSKRPKISNSQIRKSDKSWARSTKQKFGFSEYLEIIFQANCRKLKNKQGKKQIGIETGVKIFDYSKLT